MSRAESMRLVRDLEKKKFRVERTGSGHWKVSHPDGGKFVVIAFSPRGSGRHKTLKRLKEIGYEP